MSYLKNRKNAFTYAFSGLWQAFRSEVHLQLHVIIALVVIGAGCYFSISKAEWFAVGLCITLVISLELANSAAEKLCDLYSKEQNPKIKYVKDVMAASVLVASFFAAITGIVIFLPYIKQLFNN